MYDYFATIWRDITSVPAKKDLMFGNRNEIIFSTSNLLCLFVKYYIWKTRCSGKNLSFNSCLSWMRLELHITRLVYGTDKRLAHLNNYDILQGYHA